MPELTEAGEAEISIRGDRPELRTIEARRCGSVGPIATETFGDFPPVSAIAETNNKVGFQSKPTAALMGWGSADPKVRAPIMTPSANPRPVRYQVDMALSAGG